MTARFDLFTPEARKNPHPMYAEMRWSSPVCQVDPGGIWAVSRYDDVLFVLKHPEIFSSQGFRLTLLAPWLPDNPIADSLVLMDPPNHGKMRALVSRAFTPGIIVRLEPRIRAIAEELAADLERRGEADFVADFAVPLPSRVICELLGLDPALHAEFSRWNQHIGMVSPVTPAEVIPMVQQTMKDIIGHLTGVIEARRSVPARDLVSDLLRAEVDGMRLTDREIMGFMLLILIAGFETTSNLLSKSLLGLTQRPADLARLRSSPALVPRFTDEALRHEGAAESLLRLTTTEVTLAGTTIPAGSIVAAVLASANRDERRFPDADRFDMDRDTQGILSFGHGIHYCIGAALARAEMKAGYEALLSRFERFERTSGEIPWNCSLVVRSPLSMPVRFVPVSAAQSPRSMRSPRSVRSVRSEALAAGAPISV